MREVKRSRREALIFAAAGLIQRIVVLFLGDGVGKFSRLLHRLFQLATHFRR